MHRTLAPVLAAVLFTLTACGVQPPPKEQLVAVAEQFYGAFNAGDKQQLLDLTDAAFTDHMSSPRPDDGGKGNLAFAVEAFKQGYPDLKIVIEKTWQDESTLTVFTKVTGTNTGSLFGMAPTGKPVAFSTIDVLGIEGGKLKDLWHIEQQHQMFQQLMQ